MPELSKRGDKRLTHATIRGKSGFSLLSIKIASAKAQFCTMKGENGMNVIIQLKSFRACVISGGRSSRYAVVAKKIAGTEKVMQAHAPETSCAAMRVWPTPGMRFICCDIAAVKEP